MGRRGKKTGGAEQDFRAALYIRLSREDGDREESDSVANQRALLTDYARADETIADYELFIDAAVIIGLKTLRLKKCWKFGIF